MSVKAIIFDFDGVILPDSQHAKDTAYEELFSHKEESVRSVLPSIALRYGGGKGDRTDIIRDLFESLHSRTPSAAELKNLLGDFSRIIGERIGRMSPPLGTMRTLESLSRNYPLYLVSATPEKELKERAVTLRLDGFFVSIIGRPTTKDEAVRIVVQKEAIPPSEILLVGDSDGDYETARLAGLRFVGVKNSWNVWPREHSFPVVSTENLEEINQLLG